MPRLRDPTRIRGQIRLIAAATAFTSRRTKPADKQRHEEHDIRTHPSPYATASTPLTLAEIANLPVVLDIPTTARLLGIGRSTAYTLAAQDALPVPVLRAGQVYRIPTAPLLAVLGITTAPHANHGPDTHDTAPAGTAQPAQAVPSHAPTSLPYTS